MEWVGSLVVTFEDGGAMRRLLLPVEETVPRRVSGVEIAVQGASRPVQS